MDTNRQLQIPSLVVATTMLVLCEHLALCQTAISGLLANTMNFLSDTRPTAAENLAIDEALLQMVEPTTVESTQEKPSRSNQAAVEVLRIWQPYQTSIILGRSSRLNDEVFTQQAEADKVPILRRISGGATVVIGPGCLMYSLLIDLQRQPQLRMLDAVHRLVMERTLQAVRQHRPGASFQGTCDLVLGDRKFSGNSLRVGRNWTLYHGTLLLQMDLPLIDRYLRHPPKEPEYRAGRSHAQFVTNLELPAEPLIASLRGAWDAAQSLVAPPPSWIDALVEQRYGQASWNYQR